MSAASAVAAIAVEAVVSVVMTAQRRASRDLSLVLSLAVLEATRSLN